MKATLTLDSLILMTLIHPQVYWERRVQTAGGFSFLSSFHLLVLLFPVGDETPPTSGLQPCGGGGGGGEEGWGGVYRHGVRGDGLHYRRSGVRFP